MEKMKKRISLVATIAIISVLTCSCGYQLINQKGIYGGEIKSLDVGVFKNITYEPHASLYVTNAFSQELTLTGLFDLNQKSSDAYIEGTIRRVLIQPSSMNAQGVVIEKTATVDVDIALYRKNGTFIKRWFFTDFEPYRVDDIQAEDYNKRDALNVISGRMARKFCAVVLVDY
jgi:outer membrane lipopolysaccharide assembly protein LptE/RlpB